MKDSATRTALDVKKMSIGASHSGSHLLSPLVLSSNSNMGGEWKIYSPKVYVGISNFPASPLNPSSYGPTDAQIFTEHNYSATLQPNGTWEIYINVIIFNWESLDDVVLIDMYGLGAGRPAPVVGWVDPAAKVIGGYANSSYLSLWLYDGSNITTLTPPLTLIIRSRGPY